MKNIFILLLFSLTTLVSSKVESKTVFVEISISDGKRDISNKEIMRNLARRFDLLDISYSFSDESIGQNKLIIQIHNSKNEELIRNVILLSGRIIFRLIDSEGSKILFDLAAKYREKSISIFDKQGLIKTYRNALPKNSTVLKLKRDFIRMNGITAYSVVSDVEFFNNEDIIDHDTVKVYREGYESRVEFSLKSKFKDTCSQIFKKNIGKQLAVIINDTVIRTPQILGSIPSGRFHLYFDDRNLKFVFMILKCKPIVGASFKIDKIYLK